ncbi:hypothetical protein LX99_04837 [Mucilaginibacter oryzae]|uniref:Tetratricopeptide repeat protein n=1 Tax=Mucilaginibacter oryzae TaxID=468058 RepID=A0A316GWV8_9SPHI|nr:hypothetical protein [Mucilaginibacter oryzae]PWK68312.1 hypothetical protein LX99_04837 [Mucilaginibacter oryzae]
MPNEKFVDWEKINNGHQGFERLANEFVAKEIGFDVKWRATQLTRDGNKDGIAILYCYLPLAGTTEEQIWMEAKYSLTQQNLSRYKLDSTIVSAIIEGNVKEIIFITNIEIELSVEQKIKQALMNALRYNENNVAFFSRWTLERWLLLHPEIYQRYFPDAPQIPASFFQDLYCTDKISFHQKSYSIQYFTEPLQHLYTDQVYNSFLRIFSPADQTARITSLNAGLKIKNNHWVTDNRIRLKQGINTIELDVECVLPAAVSGPVIRIGDLELFCNRPVEISRKTAQPTVSIASQENIMAAILSVVSGTVPVKGFVFQEIRGAGANGKTRMIEIIASKGLKNKDTIVAAFTDDQLMNSRLLLDVVLSVLFYYLDLESIDVAYLHELKKRGLFISSYLEDLVGAREQPEKLHRLLSKFEAADHILIPPLARLNDKLILLDDLHKLDDSNRLFVNHLLVEIGKSQLTGLAVVAARESYFESAEYLFFRKNNISRAHQLELTIDDVLDSFKKNQLELPELTARVLFSRQKLNCLLLIDLIRQLQDRSEPFDDAGLILFFREFLNGDTYLQSVLNRFAKTDADQDFRAVVNAVYLSSGGVLPSALKDHHKKTVPQLIHFELIRYSPDGRIIPYHDFYTKIFRERYQNRFLECFSDNGYLFTEIEETKYRLMCLFEDEKVSIQHIVGQLRQLSEMHRFYPVIYILEPVFQQENRSAFRDRLGAATYYELYFMYARAIGHTSKHYAGNDEIKQIIQETAFLTDTDIRWIRIKALAEMMNTSFEYLLFDDISRYSVLLDDLFNVLIMGGEFEQEALSAHPSYILADEIRILKAMSTDDFTAGDQLYSNLVDRCLRHGLWDKSGILKIRFARTLYHADLPRAKQLIQEGIAERLKFTNDVDDKWVIIGNFEIAFLMAISEGLPLKNVLNAHERLRTDLFSDYRRAMNALAAIYLIKGDLAAALNIFTQEVDITRAPNPRFRAIRLQLSAAYEYLKGNTRQALDHLDQQSRLFVPLGQSYQDIAAHNIGVVNAKERANHITIYFGGTRKEDIFYIDARLW